MIMILDGISNGGRASGLIGWRAVTMQQPWAMATARSDSKNALNSLVSN